jgi:hypothetical protein
LGLALPPRYYELRVRYRGERKSVRVYPLRRKREAIRQARRVCRDLPRIRWVDVVWVEGPRTSGNWWLVYHCHYSAAERRLIQRDG